MDGAPDLPDVDEMTLRHALEGVDYPAPKEALLERAHDNGADSDVTRVLEALPEEDYGGTRDVVKAYASLHGAAAGGAHAGAPPL